MRLRDLIPFAFVSIALAACGGGGGGGNGASGNSVESTDSGSTYSYDRVDGTYLSKLWDSISVGRFIDSEQAFFLLITRPTVRLHSPSQPMRLT